MRETKTRIEIDGRKFIIKKLPAGKSYALLVDVLTKALPLNIIGSALEQFVPANMLNLAGKQQMTDEEFEKLQIRLLSCVSEELKAFPVEVVDEEGHVQVDDLEFNMVLWGQLLVKSVEWQWKDFFIEAMEKVGVKLDNPEILKSMATNTLSNGMAK